MAIYNFNEVSGGGTPVDVEVNQLKIGDVIFTNRQNVESYELEGVKLLKLDTYSKIVDASLYPKIALLQNYNYNSQILSTEFVDDLSYAIDDINNKFVLRDTENTFLLFPNNSNILKKLNSNNTVTVLNTNSPNFTTSSIFVNFDNYTKVLCLYKESTNLKYTIYNKITNSFSNPQTLATCDATTGKFFAARLMSDDIIYIAALTTTGNMSIFKTLDGIVFENFHTTTINHWSTINSNSANIDEKGTMNINDDFFYLYYIQQTGTSRTLNYINLFSRQKVSNVYTMTTTSNLSTHFAVNYKSKQVLIYRSQNNITLGISIYDTENFLGINYNCNLNSNSAVSNIILVDFNNLFVFQDSSKILSYSNNFNNFTFYNYPVLDANTLEQFYINLDFRYNNIIFLYAKNNNNILKRTINTIKANETLLIPRSVFLGQQVYNYLVTDLEDV